MLPTVQAVDEPAVPPHTATQGRHARLTGALRRVVLMRETGPKRAAWHRARVQTIWRLHRLLAETPPTCDDPAPPPEETP
jgi:hypothetical protein